MVIDSAVAHSCWSTNLQPYLQVTFRLSGPVARRLLSMSLAVETVCMLPMGLYVWRTGRFHRVLEGAAFLYLLAEVLLILAVRYQVFGLLVSSLVLTSMTRATFEAVKEVALLSGARWKQDTAMLLALLSLSDRVGGMIGATVSDILWAKALPNAPTRYLNAQTIWSAERVNSLLATHLAYPPGSPEGNATVQTYGATQLQSVAVGIGVMALACGCVSRMYDISLINAEKTFALQELWGRKYLKLQAMADSGWGEDLRNVLQDPSRRVGLAAALRVDSGRYAALEAIKNDDDRLELLRVLEAVELIPAGTGSATYLEVWKGYDRRVELLKAAQDDAYRQDLLRTLEDADHLLKYAEALHSYRQRLYLREIEKLLDLRKAFVEDRLRRPSETNPSSHAV